MDIGTKIDGGRYVVCRPFGRWALGDVFLAEETGTERLVVMRSLPEIFLSAETEFSQQFEKTIAEIQKVSAHPGIMPSLGHILDAQRNQRFLLSLYIDGETLAAFRSQRPNGLLSPDDALEMARKIAIVLNHAHLEGVCHRNLNPGNVIILPGGEVRLVNFGLSYALRSLAWSRGVDFDQTVLQEQVPYASPEQYVVKSAGMGQGRDTLLFAEHGGARFLGQTPDSGGDIYALAVMFYEMVSGRPPFSDADRLALSAARWRNEGPIPQALPMLSDEQNMILERALHWDPRQRLASAMAFIHALTPSPAETTTEVTPVAAGEPEPGTPALLDRHGDVASSAIPEREEEATSEQVETFPGNDQENRGASARSVPLTHEAAWYQGLASPDDQDRQMDAERSFSSAAAMEQPQRSYLWLWVVLAILIVAGVFGFLWWESGEEDSGVGLPDSTTSAGTGQLPSPEEAQRADSSTSTGTEQLASPSSFLQQAAITKDAVISMPDLSNSL
ncbi:MAG: serine/threonine protein kinase, partial [Magnetococcales bacterium]|nr:serine/threonine protein kinase [Magnetococcales bacterium]